MILPLLALANLFCRPSLITCTRRSKPPAFCKQYEVYRDSLFTLPAASQDPFPDTVTFVCDLLYILYLLYRVINAEMDDFCNQMHLL